MRAGVKDYLTAPVAVEDLSNSLDQITGELQSQRSRKTADLLVIINAKGGSGASVIATNLAYIDAVEMERRTLLVDMDLQLGAIPSYLNLPHNNGFMKAIENVETLDAAAMDGIVLKHEKGLRVLAASQDKLVFSEDIPQSRIAALFRLLGDTYDEIVVDMPRYLDSKSSLILQHADKIVLMMEASLAHVHDAKLMLELLQQALGLPKERFVVVVNRYDKNGSIRLSDVKEALTCDTIVSLPSDFRRVNNSINIGSPLLESERNAPITKSIGKLAILLRGTEVNMEGSKFGRNFFKRIFTSRPKAE
jgi:pilus assembly protein CpaE